LVRLRRIGKVFVFAQVVDLSLHLQRDSGHRSGFELSGGARYIAQSSPRSRRSALSLKSHLALFVLVPFSLLAVPLSAQDLNIKFQASPPVDSIRPHAGLVKLSVLVSDGAGKPVESGWVEIRLDAPKPGRFFSTDISLVEGTKLGEMRLPLKLGKAEWQYAWPIRGEYRLAVEAATADGKKASKIFAISVRESSTKWLALAGFTLGLFLIGFVAGRIFTATTASLVGSMLTLFLFGAALPSAVAQASPASGQPAQATLTVEPAVVGKPSRITWRLHDGVKVPSEAMMLTLAITQLEEGHAVFAIEKLLVAREFALDFQFVDGSEHRVTTVAELPGRTPISTERIISVTPVEPPAAAALPALAFFVFVIALGLGVGRWSKLRLTIR
jgi:hypothetical protein